MAVAAGTGQPLWEQSLTEQTKTKVPEWGFSSSVVIEGNQLLVESGGIASFDKSTGKLNWHVGPHKIGYGSPAVFTHDNYRYAVSLNNQTVQADQLAENYRIEAVPTMAVNGEYQAMGKNLAEILANTDRLIAQVHTEVRAAGTPAKHK